MNLSIHAAAEQDILREVERCAALAIPEVGIRFRVATIDALDRLLLSHPAGASKTLTDPTLAGLRTWPVRGFDAFRIYYLSSAEKLTVVRILHARRDICRSLEEAR